MEFHKDYGDTEGPLGFPMKDAVAKAVDEIRKALPTTPEFGYRKFTNPDSVTELNPGERSDVSWISTEAPDRGNEVVLAAGMDDKQFAKNPMVPLQHAYHLPPVGKSVWRKKIKDGNGHGIKAKTKYPPMPADWPRNDDGSQKDWPPDKVFGLIQASLLQGKSIGFLPLKSHIPDTKEYKAHGWQDGAVDRVFDEWLLLEYSAVFMPMNQDALVEQVSKGVLSLPDDLRRALGMDDELWKEVMSGGANAPPETKGQKIIAFTTLEEVEKAVARRLGAINYQELVTKAVENAFDKARGRI
jgi:hypothetical protein